MVLCGVILSLMKLVVLVRFGLDVTTRDSVFVGNVVSVCIHSYCLMVFFCGLVLSKKSKLEVLLLH